jgi:hypothetical protein
MLGHEVSHLELAETRIEIGTRRAVTLHFRIFGRLVAIFVLLLGFIDRRGLGSTPPWNPRQRVWWQNRRRISNRLRPQSKFLKTSG